MLGTDILMSRALRYVLDQHSVAPETYAMMPTNLRDQLESLVYDIAEDMRYNQLKYFRPFDHNAYPQQCHIPMTLTDHVN